MLAQVLRLETQAHGVQANFTASVLWPFNTALHGCEAGFRRHSHSRPRARSAAQGEARLFCRWLGARRLRISHLIEEEVVNVLGSASGHSLSGVNSHGARASSCARTAGQNAARQADISGCAT